MFGAAKASLMDKSSAVRVIPEIQGGAHIHVNADPSVIKRWVADLADGRFDGVRRRFDVGRRP